VVREIPNKNRRRFRNFMGLPTEFYLEESGEARNTEKKEYQIFTENFLR
jgi:hypothetical protein